MRVAGGASDEATVCRVGWLLAFWACWQKRLRIAQGDMFEGHSVGAAYERLFPAALMMPPAEWEPFLNHVGDGPIGSDAGLPETWRPAARLGRLVIVAVGVSQRRGDATAEDQSQQI
jgi:hypothetical protein